MAGFLHKIYFGGNGQSALLPRPDRLLSSTAIRALTTAQKMREVLKMDTRSLLLDSRLYLAEPDTILNVTRELDEDWRHVVMFGHNPGVHDFIDRILARTTVPGMPTCAVAMLGLPHEHWGLADWGEAQLIAYITPKALERRFPSEFAGVSKAGAGDD